MQTYEFRPTILRLYEPQVSREGRKGKGYTMDRQDTKIKLAAKILLEYLLEHREALKITVQQLHRHNARQLGMEEKLAAPQPVQLYR